MDLGKRLDAVAKKWQKYVDNHQMALTVAAAQIEDGENPDLRDIRDSFMYGGKREIKELCELAAMAKNLERVQELRVQSIETPDEGAAKKDEVTDIRSRMDACRNFLAKRIPTSQIRNHLNVCVKLLSQPYGVYQIGDQTALQNLALIPTDDRNPNESPRPLSTDTRNGTNGSDPRRGIAVNASANQHDSPASALPQRMRKRPLTKPNRASIRAEPALDHDATSESPNRPMSLSPELQPISAESGVSKETADANGDKQRTSTPWSFKKDSSEDGTERKSRRKRNSSADGEESARRPKKRSAQSADESDGDDSVEEIGYRDGPYGKPEVANTNGRLSVSRTSVPSEDQSELANPPIEHLDVQFLVSGTVASNPNYRKLDDMPDDVQTWITGHLARLDSITSVNKGKKRISWRRAGPTQDTTCAYNRSQTKHSKNVPSWNDENHIGETCKSCIRREDTPCIKTHWTLKVPSVVVLPLPPDMRGKASPDSKAYYLAGAAKKLEESIVSD